RRATTTAARRRPSRVRRRHRPRAAAGSRPARGDMRAVADLLVPAAVGGPVELYEIEAMRLVARRAAGRDHVLAGLERLRRDADVGELVLCVHREPPRPGVRLGAARGGYDQHGVWIDELE